MTEPTVTVLCTANLRGDLALLPRLHTLIQAQRRTSAGPVFLLDLGDTCAAEAWVCRATRGRAPFLVLDAMGYDAAIIGGPEAAPIPPAALRPLLDRIGLRLVVWNRAVTLRKREISLTVAPGQAESPAAPTLFVDRSTSALPAVGARRVTLGDAPRSVLARVDLTWPDWIVQSAVHLPLEPATPADPVIAAVVELVEQEARLYAEQGGSP